jgi:phosphoglucomutase
MSRNDDAIKRKAQEYVSREGDETFRSEVEQLLQTGDIKELTDRFYTNLEFGTGGLRGVIGGGYNRMNPFIIQQATQGLANYVLASGDRNGNGELTAVIAHDSRRYSDRFALESALVLAANGIKAHLFPSLRPTPELSFTARQLKASVGIVITASHNPPDYNGYKVYWSDGSQVVAPHDTGIIEEVRKVTTEIKTLSKEDAQSKGLLEYLGSDRDDAFVEMVKRTSLRPELLKEHGGDVTVVYTPLHGTGAMMVERVLGELGVKVLTVPEQREPDGEFPTVEFPNPEESAALKMAVDLGKKEKADIVMGTDPDADRLGIAVPDGDDFRLITGNQLGVLLVDYIFASRKELGKLPERPAFVTTIVTTDLQRRVARHYGAEVYDTLTGFKHIAALMRKFEADPNGPTYVAGDEESYGYLLTPEVRDKDSISAVLLTTEMTLYHVQQGKSVVDRLNEIYQEHGFFEDIQISRYFRGQQGVQVMQGMMETLRSTPPKALAGEGVTEMRDIHAGTTTRFPSGETTHDIDLPASNVLQFILADGTVVSARPSGTEPKIKFYASVPGSAGTPLEEQRPAVQAKAERLQQEITAMLDAAEGG